MSAMDLAKACCDTTNEMAWLEFYRRFNRDMTVVAGAVAASNGQHSFHLYDEIVQEMYVRICNDGCRFLQLFSPRTEHEASALIRDLASKTARNFFRDAHRKKRSGGTRVSADELDFLDVSSSRKDESTEIEQQILVQDLLRRLKSTLRSSRFASRDELIFRLRFQEGFTAREIAGLPNVGLSARGVEGSIRRSVSRLKTVFDTSYEVKKFSHKF